MIFFCPSPHQFLLILPPHPLWMLCIAVSIWIYGCVWLRRKDVTCDSDGVFLASCFLLPVSVLACVCMLSATQAFPLFPMTLNLRVRTCIQYVSSMLSLCGERRPLRCHTDICCRNFLSVGKTIYSNHNMSHARGWIMACEARETDKRGGTLCHLKFDWYTLLQFELFIFDAEKRSWMGWSVPIQDFKNQAFDTHKMCTYWGTWCAVWVEFRLRSYFGMPNGERRSFPQWRGGQMLS